MPESKSGALPLGDIPIKGARGADTRRIIARAKVFCNNFFKYIQKYLFLVGDGSSAPQNRFSYPVDQGDVVGGNCNAYECVSSFITNIQYIIVKRGVICQIMP